MTIVLVYDILYKTFYMGILDTIITNKQNESLQQFNPSEIVREIISSLKERDKEILLHRYGLEGKQQKTLAAIGEQQNLTRERVRQIEKDLVKKLKKYGDKQEKFVSTKEFLLNIIADHGRIIAEENLLLHLNIEDQKEKNSIVFLLHLIEELENFMDDNYKKSWVSILFKPDLLHEFTGESTKIISASKEPISTEKFLEEFKRTEFYETNKDHLADQIILNFLELAVQIEKNVFGHWGLKDSKEIKPKDVGDKAYLVMKHYGKPRHYSEITEMINKAGFDKKTAYKETVHNELIKDKRFILIGRGIYALAEWGYKPGVVSEVIVDVLKRLDQPMHRDKIVEAVLKNRLVKKNTILVGLSNKKLFKKVGKNLYTLAGLAQ